MKRIILLICLTASIVATALAIPARPGVMTCTQSDGTVVSFERFGDEFNHYTLVDGLYSVVEDADGDFCFATIKDNILVSSGVKVRPSNKLSSREKEIATQSIGLRQTTINPLFNREMHSPESAFANRVQAMDANRAALNEQALEIASWGGSVIGERKLLVILVEYTDVYFSLDNPREKFEKLLNDKDYSVNGSNGSVRDYFMDASNGKFTPHFDVAGPYRLPNSRAHYGANTGAGGDDARPAQQTVDACNAADGDVDFSKYDNDGDGKIDLLFIVYAGHNEAEGGPEDSVWPHNWDIYPGGNILQNTYPEYDGKQLTTYSCSSELQLNYGTMMCNIGTFCHEFGHALGLPDWYDTKGGAGFGLSYASIMNSGNYLNNSRTPPTYNIIERWLLGWAFPKEISDTGYYEISHISNDDAYIIWANDNKTECFLFEARTKGANYKWDKYLNSGDSEYNFQGGEGMLIYHLDWDGDVYQRWVSHTINTVPTHECARLFRASPSATESSSKSWFFPGSRNIKSLSYDSSPRFQNWDQEKFPFYLDNISVLGDKVAFNVTVKEVVVDVRQYDALIDWRAAKNTASTWKVVCNTHDGEVVYETTTKDKYINIYPLNANTSYIVHIYADNNTEPDFELGITTHNNVLSPMSALNMSGTYKADSYIRLGVKNLDCVMEDIVWYIDGQRSEETYLKLATGKHLVTAAITDTDGNTIYLYRYITVQ